MLNRKNLIEKAKAGDLRAKARLYEQNIDSLYRYVIHKVDTKERAEDICAEAFVKAYESLDKFEGKSSFKTWVYTIAKNLIYDWYKQKGSSAVNLRSVDIEIRGQEDFDSTIDDNSESVEQTLKVEHEVVRILNELKTNYAQVLELRFLLNMNIKEAAEAMETTPGNIKVLQNRALKRAREVALLKS